MKKIAYNACYGGFGISDKAVKWLIENESDNLEKAGLLEDLCTYSFDDTEHRKNPSLIRVIETLGDEANGSFAKLRIQKLNNDVKYRITEYDGYETVETINSIEWSD